MTLSTVAPPPKCIGADAVTRYREVASNTAPAATTGAPEAIAKRAIPLGSHVRSPMKVTSENPEASR